MTRVYHLTVLFIVLCRYSLSNGVLDGEFEVSGWMDFTEGLQNESVSALLLSASLTIPSSLWTPVQVSRPLIIGGAPGIVLDLSGYPGGLIDVVGEGTLEVVNITLVNFLNRNQTYGLLDGPIPSLTGINTTSRSRLTNMTLYIDMSAGELASLSLWWQEWWQQLLSRPERTSKAISLNETRSGYQITGCVLVADPNNSCRPAAIAQSSTGLMKLLRDPRIQNISMVTSITLSRSDFSTFDPVVIRRPVSISVCGSNTTLDLSYIKEAVVAGGGGFLILDSLRVTGSKSSLRVDLPSNNSLLLSAFRTQGNGTVRLQNVVLEAPDFQNIKTQLAESSRTGWRADWEYRASGNPPVEYLVISGWNISQGSESLSPMMSKMVIDPQSTPPPPSWLFSNVRVEKQREPAGRCLGAGRRAVANWQGLLSALEARDVNDILVTHDISLSPRDMGNPLSLTISRAVTLTGCLGNGTRPELKFPDDEGAIRVVTGGRLMLHHLIIVAPVRRRQDNTSLPWEMIAAVRPEGDGAVELEDVELQGTSLSPLHQALYGNDSWFSSWCPQANRPNVTLDIRWLNSAQKDAGVYIRRWRFFMRPWLETTNFSVGGGNGTLGDGYWSFVDCVSRVEVSSDRRASFSAEQMLAITLPSVLVPMTLAAIALTVSMWVRYQQQQKRFLREAREEEKVGQPPSVLDLDVSSTKISTNKDSSLDTGMKIEAARQQIGAGRVSRDQEEDDIQLGQVLGEGTFGKVYKGTWRGSLVAVKTMVFPASMSGRDKSEKMAIMETAISSSLAHPNVVQTFTYVVHSVRVSPPSTSGRGAGTPNSEHPNGSHNWEVRLVLEYCDLGTLRELLNSDGFRDRSGHPDMLVILDTALDIAKAMVHLHRENIIHSDLKARNVLLKSSGLTRHGFVAKVADFGLSTRIDPGETHISNVYQGTLTHLPPEALVWGRLSPACDVYAFGILMWELYTGAHAFKDVPRALLAHEVSEGHRPEFPMNCPVDYRFLAWRCWESDPSKRPTFRAILVELRRIRVMLFPQEGMAVDPLPVMNPSTSSRLPPDLMQSTIVHPDEESDSLSFTPQAGLHTQPDDEASDYRTSASGRSLDVVVVGGTTSDTEYEARPHFSDLGSGRQFSWGRRDPPGDGSGRSHVLSCAEVRRSFERRQLMGHDWVDPVIVSRSDSDSDDRWP